ncbi:MAG: hypothetical protein LDLANPLL_01961 [Turneriella sp.]|nr:hypothetical protein [Turneriella sp.]
MGTKDKKASQKISKKMHSAKDTTLSLAEKIFAITTHRYINSAKEFLPTNYANVEQIQKFQHANKDTIASLKPITDRSANKATQQKILTYGRTAAQKTMVVMARAALFVVAIGAGLTLISYVADDSIRIEDERGKSALNNEIRAKESAISLNVMRKRKKIGEFTLSKGSRLRIVKASNGDIFRPVVTFDGNEADFKLKYKGKTSLVVSNGPFKAKVKIAQGVNNDIHLRFKESGALLPVGNPKFSIEVVKGDVQIAETEDNIFEDYSTGEQAVFTLSSSDTSSENL